MFGSEVSSGVDGAGPFVVGTCAKGSRGVADEAVDNRLVTSKFPNKLTISCAVSVALDELGVASIAPVREDAVNPRMSPLDIMLGTEGVGADRGAGATRV